MRKIALIALLALGGCGNAARTEAAWKGHANVCVDGVTYIQFASGATIKVDRSGKPVPCVSK